MCSPVRLRASHAAQVQWTRNTVQTQPMTECRPDLRRYSGPRLCRADRGAARPANASGVTARFVNTAQTAEVLRQVQGRLAAGHATAQSHRAARKGRQKRLPQAAPGTALPTHTRLSRLRGDHRVM
jgi:hypothetical protein